MDFLKTTLILFLLFNAVLTVENNYYELEHLNADGFYDEPETNWLIANLNILEKTYNTEEGYMYAEELKHTIQGTDEYRNMKGAREWIAFKNLHMDPIEGCKKQVFKIFDSGHYPYTHYFNALHSLSLAYLAKKKANGHVLGYFKYLYTKSFETLEKTQIIMSPRPFCGQTIEGKMVFPNVIECMEALQILFIDRDADPEEEINHFNHMSGPQALKHIYFNHRINDIEDLRVFPVDYTQSSNSAHMDRIRKSCIMISYYNHLLKVAENASVQCFPTVDQYCDMAVASAS